jgi:hypothetical protein
MSQQTNVGFNAPRFAVGSDDPIELASDCTQSSSLDL